MANRDSSIPVQGIAKPRDPVRIAKPFVFTACLLPLAWLGLAALNDGLGANPIEAITRFNGDWALRFLLITLTITPLRRLTGWNRLIRFRRMLGLFSFFYATLHIASYVVLDQFFDWPAIGTDLLKRPYITVGMLTFLLLLPLAVTSTNGWMRRLGGRRWQRLHRLVYPAAVGGVVHFALMVKADLREPLIYGAILAVLLAVRLPLKNQPKALSRAGAADTRSFGLFNRIYRIFQD